MNIFARSALLGIFVLLPGVPTGHSVEYFIYQDAKGVLVISNQNFNCYLPITKRTPVTNGQ